MTVWLPSEVNRKDIIAYTNEGIVRIKYISPRRYDVYIATIFSGKYTTQAKAKAAAEKHLSRIGAG